MLSRETVILRAAHASEASAIASISRLHVEYGLRWRWTPARVKRAIADTETQVLVATRHGEILGFAIMKFGDRQAHLHLLAVRPDHRRAGVGRAMLEWLEKSCRAAGIVEIRLEVRTDNMTARRFYDRLGYRHAGQVPGYYDRREDAALFAKALTGDLTA